MTQKEAMIQNFISELISFLPASTIDEKNIKKIWLLLSKSPFIYIGIDWFEQYEQLCVETLKILLWGWHQCLPHSHIAFKCIVLNFHTPFTTNGVDLFYVVDNE